MKELQIWDESESADSSVGLVVELAKMLLYSGIPEQVLSHKCAMILLLFDKE